MKRLLTAILLATTLTASAWVGRVWQPVDGPEINGTWGQWSGVQSMGIKQAEAIERKVYGRGAAQAFAIVTGTTQQVDEVTGETNTVDVTQQVPYGVLRADGTIESPTATEWQAKTAWLAAIDAAVMQAKIAGYGAFVQSLQDHLTALGYTLPCDPSQVMGELVYKSANGLLTDAQEDEKRDLGLLYGLISKMLTDAEIVEIWQAMQGGQ